MLTQARPTCTVAALAFASLLGLSWPQGVAVAQQAGDDMVALLGSGSSWTCREWMQARQDDPMHDPEPASWVLGFLSGAAVWSDPQYQGVGHDPLRGVGPDVVLSWVDRWCHSNPSHPVFAAASSFVRANSHGRR